MSNNPRVLHLTIKKKWFDDILSGSKKLEFRQNKPYWNRRLDGKHFDEVLFRNGYRKDSPTMRVEILSINRWVYVYAIELGKVLEYTLNGKKYICNRIDLHRQSTDPDYPIGTVLEQGRQKYRYSKAAGALDGIVYDDPK